MHPCVVPEQCVLRCVWFPSSVHLGACVVQEMELGTWEYRESAPPLTYTPSQFVLCDDFPLNIRELGDRLPFQGHVRPS